MWRNKNAVERRGCVLNMRFQLCTLHLLLYELSQIDRIEISIFVNGKMLCSCNRVQKDFAGLCLGVNDANGFFSIRCDIAWESSLHIFGSKTIAIILGVEWFSFSFEPPL